MPTRCAVVCLGMLVCRPLLSTAQSPLIEAHKARARGAPGEALRIVDEALRSRSADVRQLLMFRGFLHGEMGNPERAVADFTTLVKESPTLVQPWYLRGREHYRLGRLEESIADFEKVLELEPDRRTKLWELGIAYYQVGRFRDGQAMFEAYQTFDDADVENVVWRYLCMAREQGPEAARSAIFPVGSDRRVPMREIYALYAGRGRPEEVLAAAEDGAAQGRAGCLFYAHLYLGLYHEAQGQAAQAREHLAKAATEFRSRHYMGDVARVHLQRRDAEAGKAATQQRRED